MITTSILAKVDNERLQRGVEGLANGAYAITLTRLTEGEISAYVTNGDNKTYSVSLTEGKAFCGCGDAMFRGKTCKHSVARALFVIRMPQAEVKPATTLERKKEQPQAAPNLRLAKVRRECYARSVTYRGERAYESHHLP